MLGKVKNFFRWLYSNPVKMSLAVLVVLVLFGPLFIWVATRIVRKVPALKTLWEKEASVLPSEPAAAAATTTVKK